MDHDPVHSVSRAYVFFFTKKPTVDLDRDVRVRSGRVYTGIEETETTIQVFKYTINPGHGKEHFEQKGKNRREYVTNFKPHELISVE